MSHIGGPASINLSATPVRRRFGSWGLILASLAVVLLATTGCEDDESAKPGGAGHTFTNETVTVAVPKGRGFSEVWKGLLDEWSEQTGATYRLVEYEETTAGAKDLPTGDLIVLPFVDLGEFVAADRLAPMPAAMVAGESATAWLDLFAGLRERVLSIGGTPTVVPFSCPVLTCYLRRDLLEKAGLKPPHTWDEYQALVDSSSKWAPGLSIVEPWSPDFRATMFLARALPTVKSPGGFSVFFDIDTGEPLIDSPGFVRALGQSVAAVSKMAADVKTLTPADCRRLILTGKAAMAVAFEPGRSDEKPMERPAGISLSFVRLPGMREIYSRASKSWSTLPDQGVNDATLVPFAGLAAGVSKSISPKRAEAAWNLAIFLGLDRYEQAFVNAPKSVCRESQLSGTATWVSPDLRPNELFGYCGVTAECLRQPNISAELPVVGHSRFRQALTEGLTAALEGKASPEAALKGVAQRWRAISKELGVDRVRDSYRRCLGLPAAMNLPELPESAGSN
jgi:ABC-type glycerol-3-phosphate transport system substrate-binding protein